MGVATMGDLKFLQRLQAVCNLGRIGRRAGGDAPEYRNEKTQCETSLTSMTLCDLTLPLKTLA